MLEDNELIQVYKPFAGKEIKVKPSQRNQLTIYQPFVFYVRFTIYNFNWTFKKYFSSGTIKLIMLQSFGFK